MKILKWLLFAFINLLISMLSWVLINPILCLFTSGNDLLFGKKYWQTFDNDLYAGQHGREKEILTDDHADTWGSFIPWPCRAWQRYLNRLLWLTRNCCYGFAFFVFGLAWKKEDWRIVKFVDTPTRTLFFATSATAFNLYWQGRFGLLKLGWKAWNMFDTKAGAFVRDTWMNVEGLDRVPHVFSISLKRKSPT